MIGTLDLSALDTLLGIARPAGPTSPLGSLVWRPSLRNRNDTAFLSARSWSSATRRRDMAAFKAEKIAKTSAVIDGAADELGAS
jgi:hypothetical protein